MPLLLCIYIAHFAANHGHQGSFCFSFPKSRLSFGVYSPRTTQQLCTHETEAGLSQRLINQAKFCISDGGVPAMLLFRKIWLNKHFYLMFFPMLSLSLKGESLQAPDGPYSHNRKKIKKSRVKIC